MESHLRSIIKAVSWRAGGTVVTILVAWILLGELELAAKIGLLDTILKIGVFYAHERVWNRIKFGTKKLPEYEI